MINLQCILRYKDKTCGLDYNTLHVCGMYSLVTIFVGCEITGNEAGVHLVLAANGRPSGEAFVELVSADDVKKALAKDKHHIGRRYIDGICKVAIELFLAIVCTHKF